MQALARYGLLVGLVVSVSGWAESTPVFTEDFESGLGAWTGKSGGAHNGVDALDPIEGDRALNFTALNSAGDIFSIATFPAGAYTLSFDYLGHIVPGSGQNAGNFGGYIGISQDLPGPHRWLEGTLLCCGAEAANLIDDGTWRRYDVSFVSAFDFHIMIEDFVGSGGIAGDAYFDNLSLQPAPEPATPLLLAAGMMAALGRRRARR